MEQNGWGNLLRMMVGLSDARQHLECDECDAWQTIGRAVVLSFIHSIAPATRRLAEGGEGL